MLNLQLQYTYYGCSTWYCILGLRQNQRIDPAQSPCAGFRKFSRKKFMHRVRAACPRGFDSLPSLSDVGTLSFRWIKPFWYSAWKSEPRFIMLFQPEVSKRFYSSKAKGFNIHYFALFIGTVVQKWFLASIFRHAIICVCTILHCVCTKYVRTKFELNRVCARRSY